MDRCRGLLVLSLVPIKSSTINRSPSSHIDVLSYWNHLLWLLRSHWSRYNTASDRIRSSFLLSGHEHWSPFSGRLTTLYPQKLNVRSLLANLCLK